MADLFYFTYNYGNSDYYSGYGVVNTGTYTTGQTISGGTNELGLNGSYTIDFLISGGASSSLVGNIYTYAYYDGDTSKKSYSTLYGSQNVASGTNGLGSELDYITSAGLGIDVFGRAFYEADAAGIALYSFTYNYGNGDYYNGYVYATDVAYQVGNNYDISDTNNQAGFDGNYTITGAITGYDSSYNSLLGSVLVYNYYDGDTSRQNYTPLKWSQGTACSTSGLGTELDYIYSPGLGYSLFGQDIYEADAAGLALYTFTYNYGNGDYYNGYVVASNISYQVGNSYDISDANNQAGFDGNYTITGSSSLDASYAYGLGYVFVYNYYDADTSRQSYTPLKWSQQNTPSGTGGLGSELDYIYGGLSGYSPFGQDFYEADAQSVAVYSFTYDYGNGDFYNGFVYASNAAYQVGNSYDRYTANNQDGFNGTYTITGVSSGLDITYNSTQGYVFVYNYYDGDTSRLNYTPYYYNLGQTSGTSGLGFERDYIITSRGDLDLFGYDYYEADSFTA